MKLKNMKIKKGKLVKKAVKRKVTVVRKPAPARMGPVATITTAPVAIGNSIRGARSASRATPGGVVVAGRDFMFTALATGSISTWCLVGGAPLSPVSFGDSVIRQYLQMYQKYRWRRCNVHYITSSATSSTGDVMFYHGKNRDSVFLNQTSNFLLPFVISDPDTVLGPQWTNHSAALEVQGSWKSTDYGMTSNLNDYADGEVFLLSKTTTTDSPGYVLFDYEIEFAEMQISPRLLSLPLPRAQWNQLGIGGTTFATVNNTPVMLAPSGNGINGAASALPAGAAAGDVYKCIVDLTNSVGVPASLTTVKTELGNGQTGNVALQDGTTFYVVNSSGGLLFFPNSVAAYSDGDILNYSSTVTATFTLQVWISLVGTVGTVNCNPNF